ncbi:type IX secretion system plug protein, partial [Hoylesella timonensis]|uniref:type IX secretion system plug protein n=2 Tax=Hoylesella timonensis TaxID=386414 RepID=UPI00056AA7A4
MFQIKNIYTSILRLSIFFISCAIPATTFGQNAQIYKESIASLQVVAGDDWLSPPVTTLGGLPINISFDDLTHEYHRYTYSIEHCEANWTPSTQLFESDFLRGFAEDNIIKNFQKSVNTKVQYTHYSLQIPNAECQLKMSGNYRLTVYDANNDNEKILTVCFMVVEPLAQIGLDVTDNTDWD